MTINACPDVVDAIYEACLREKKQESRRTYLGMSEIGHPCDRYLWLNYNGYPKLDFDGRTARVFQCGHDREERIIADLLMAGFCISNRQREFNAFNGRFKGHCDGYITCGKSEPMILEVKTAKQEVFRRIQKEGIQAVKPEYYAQAQCYMHCDFNVYMTLFVVENKNTQALYAEVIDYDLDVAKHYFARAGMILDAECPPDVMAETKTCKYCDFCGYVCDNTEEYERIQTNVSE